MKKLYVGINNFMHKHSFIKSSTYFASKFCPWMVMIFYALFLLKIVLESPKKLPILAAKPVCVLLLTLLTKYAIDRDRPCVKYKIIPIDERKRTSRSFPSIHSGLALSIALAVLEYGPNMGLLLFTLACIISVSRILTGVHYTTDVIGSILIAIVVNMI